MIKLPLPKNIYLKMVSRHNSTATIWSCSLILGILLLINVYYFTVSLTTANPYSSELPLTTLPNGQILQEAATVSQIPLGPMAGTVVAASLAGMLILVVLTGLFLLIARRHRQLRDIRQVEATENLAKALLEYRQDFGHYPLPRSDEARPWVEGVVLSEWEVMGLPPVETMRRYEVDWPESRVGVKPTKLDGRRFLYLPLEKGQEFILFTRMEDDLLPSEEIVPLPKHRQGFNYWVSSLPEMAIPSSVQSEIMLELESWLPRKKIKWEERVIVEHVEDNKVNDPKANSLAADQLAVPELFKEEKAL